jgi:predicted permease
MRDRELREWRARVNQHADDEGRHLSHDVVDELASHLAELHAAAVRDGATDEDARDAALATLKSASFFELSKRPRARRPAAGVWQDVRLAVRQMRAAPIVSLIAVLSLALGIGANTAIFSLVDSLMLRALPVADPARLALVYAGSATTSWTNPIWEQVRSRSDRFAGATAWSTARFDLANGGEAQPVEGIWASGSFFDVLGVRPWIGRTLTPADDRRGGGPAGPVAVIGYDFWTRRFGGSADAIGRTLTIERVPFTIVGVTPPGFFGPDVGRTFDVVIPIGTEPLIAGLSSDLDQRASWWLNMMVRLKPDQSLAAAEAALRSAQPQIREATLPPTYRPEDLPRYLTTPFTLVPAATGRSPLRMRYQRPLLTILVVVALVLLVACANIANLQLARATARRHEVSLRMALGASRWRLARQFLIESLVVSCLGASAGFLFARWGGALIVSQLSTATAPVFLDLAVDWRVLGFTTAAAALTAVLFGTAPALRASRVEPIDALKDQARGSSGRRGGLLSGLVVAQVALSLVLVVAAGLFLRTFSSLATRPLGFDRERVLLVALNAPRSHFKGPELPALQHRALDAVRAVPGVSHAALSSKTPVGNSGWNNRVDVPGGLPLDGRPPLTNLNALSSDWFATYGTPLIAGRDFSVRDRDNGADVAIVNETFVRVYIGTTNPIGRILRLGSMGDAPPQPFVIVGVAADALYRSLRESIPPTVYVVHRAQPGGADRTSVLSTMYIGVRSAGGEPGALAKSVAAAIAAVDPNLVLTFRTLADQVDASITQERLVAMLAGFFGALALLLAGLGLYGVTSYAVTRRRTEIGIRLALGAAPSRVVGLVLWRVSALVGAGIIAGVVMSLWAAKFVAALLYNLEPRDPATLAGAAVVLAIIGAAAGWLPAHRAARIDPMEVLRDA